jgi:hypothetical protein
MCMYVYMYMCVRAMQLQAAQCDFANASSSVTLDGNDACMWRATLTCVCMFICVYVCEQCNCRQRSVTSATPPPQLRLMVMMRACGVPR